MSTTFVDARVGDKVWCFMYGWGVIKKVKILSSYPIHVRFKNGDVHTYTVRGELVIDGPQALFWDEIKIKAPKKQPNPKYKNVNGFKVPNVSVAMQGVSSYVQVLVLNFTKEDTWWSRMYVYEYGDILRRLIPSGMVYPDTEEGEIAITAHAKALLGEGEPWNDQE